MGTETVHDAHPACHLFAHGLFATHDVSDQKGAALHAAVVAVHGIAGTVPLFLALLGIPFVRVVALVIWYGVEVVVSGGTDFVWVEVEAMRGGLALALAFYAGYFAPHAGIEVGAGRGPGTAIYFGWMGEITAAGAKEWP